MEVYGKAVHGYDLASFRPHQTGQTPGDILMVRVPGTFGFKVSFDTISAPESEFFLDGNFGSCGHGAETVADKVEAAGGEGEVFPKGPAWVILIESGGPSGRVIFREKKRSLRVVFSYGDGTLYDLTSHFVKGPLGVDSLQGGIDLSIQ